MSEFPMFVCKEKVMPDERNMFRCHQCGGGSQDAYHVTLGHICYSCAAWSQLIEWSNGNAGALYATEKGDLSSLDACGTYVNGFADDMPAQRAWPGKWSRGGSFGRVKRRWLTFKGPDGHVWGAWEYDGMQLLRGVRRLKSTWRKEAQHESA